MCYPGQLSSCSKVSFDSDNFADILRFDIQFVIICRMGKKKIPSGFFVACPESSW